jgi:hypothetical protein
MSGEATPRALIDAANAPYRRAGDWPQGWPAPSAPVSIRGIAIDPLEISRARFALADRFEFVRGDICETAFGSADALVILDVLRYIDCAAHAPLLERAGGHGFAHRCCHALKDWQRLLEKNHFYAEAMPMSAGTPLAHLLLIARPQ